MPDAPTDHDLITRIVPILQVRDLAAERRFYQALGLRVSYADAEHPNFLGIGNDRVEFGLEQHPDFDAEGANRAFLWQLEVADVDRAIELCRQSGLAFRLRSHRPDPAWGYRTLHLETPNGYALVLEGPRE